MPYNVVYSPEASDQLEELFLYLAECSSLGIAERYISLVIASWGIPASRWKHDRMQESARVAEVPDPRHDEVKAF